MVGTAMILHQAIRIPQRCGLKIGLDGMFFFYFVDLIIFVNSSISMLFNKVLIFTIDYVFKGSRIGVAKIL